MEDRFRSDRESTDVLGDILGKSRNSLRHQIWLWLYLYFEKDADLAPRTCNSETMSYEIVKAVTDQRLFIPRIAQEKDKYLLPEETLAWIENSKRETIWLTREVEHLSGLILPFTLTHLTGKDRLIALIDIWNIDIAEKERELENIYYYWKKHQARDVELEWFSDKKEGMKRCTCAWEWLEKNYLSMSRLQRPISNYQELLIFFDGINTGPYERKAMVRDIKKRWHKKNFDERAADKKQVNLLLSKETIDQLDSPSQKHGLKRAQIVEALVAMEIEVGLVLTKK